MQAASASWVPLVADGAVRHRPLYAAALVLGAAQLRGEDLAAQRPLDKVHGACGLDQPATLGAVGRQHRLHAAGRQLAAELGAGGPVTLACALHARGQVMPGQGGERHRVPAQHAV